MAPATPASLAIRSTNVALAALLLTVTFAGLTILAPSAEAAPVINSISPTSGTTNGGTTVTITGTGFVSGALVEFGTAAELSSGTAQTIQDRRATAITFVSATSITAKTPAHATGAVNVKVTNPDGTAVSFTNLYTYTTAGTFEFDQADVSPQSGSSNGGTTLTISGTFAAGSAPPVVTFDGAVGDDVQGMVLSHTASQITVTTPPHAAETVDIIIDNPSLEAGQTATCTDCFSYSAATIPVTNAISPASGTAAGGTLVTITGSNFAPGATVEFVGDGLASRVNYVSTGVLTAVTPEGTGSALVLVTNPNGSPATGSVTYTYTTATAPTVTGVSPTTGSTLGGYVLTITGTNFHTGVNEKPIVVVDATTVADDDVTVVSSSRIDIVMPAGTGEVDVSVDNPGATAAAVASNVFEYIDVLRITGLSANQGPTAGGTSGTPTTGTITIDGEGFSTVVADLEVTFGGTRARVTAATATELTVIPPPHDDGAVQVQVMDTLTGLATTITGAYEYVNSAAPTFTSVTGSPSTNGDSTITITGTGFIFGSSPTGPREPVDANPTVTVGGVAVTVTDQAAGIKTSMTVTVPKLTGTSLNDKVVAITNPDGQTVSSSAADGVDYTAAPAPSMDDDAPAIASGSAVGGTPVLLMGPDAATSNFFYTTNGDNEPVAKVGTRTLTKNMVLPIASGGALPADLVTDFPSLPANCPAVGAGGPCLLIFTPAVSGGAADADETFTVTNPDADTATSTGAFTFDYTASSPPTFTSYSATSGTSVGGNTLTISGSNFGPVTYDEDGEDCADVDFTGSTIMTQVPTVTFGGVQGTRVCVLSSTSLQVIVPGHAAGPVSVVITNPDGRSVTASSQYTYDAVTAAPAVATISQATGSSAGGHTVTLTGTGFGPVTKDINGRDCDDVSPAIDMERIVSPRPTVTFGSGTATKVCVLSATSLTAVLPAQTAGLTTITVTNPDGQADSIGGDFRYIAAAPSATGLSVTSGSASGGTTTVLTTTGFTSTSKPTVYFGTEHADVGTTSTSTASVTSPPGTATGATNVYAIDADGQTAAVRNAFTYLFANPPSFTSISPNTGSLNGGTTVTITGVGFAPEAVVDFDGVELPATVNAAGTSLTFVTPNIAQTAEVVGSTGTGLEPIDLVVTNPGPSSKSVAINDRFAYNTLAAPVVSSVSPTTGPSTGGTTVTITGAGFVSGATVKFGTVPASGVTFNSGTQLTATTPAGSGTVTVTVTNPDNEAGSLANGFTYVGAPSITTLDPTCVPLAGGEVTITGTGFVSGATVTFGDEDGEDVEVVSSTEITVTAPAATEGGVTVTVTNPDGQMDTAEFDYAADCSSVTPPPPPPVATPPVTTPPVATPPVTSPPDLTDEDIEEANEDLADSLEVERDGDDNVLTFEVPEDAVGVQIWSSNSPYRLEETLEEGDEEFDSGTYVDEGAPEDTKYVLTAFYDGDAGFCDETDPEDCFGNWDDLEDQAATASAADDDAEGIPLWVWILIGGAILLIVLIVIAVVVTKRKKKDDEAASGEGYAWEDQPPAASPQQAAAPVPTEPVQEHAMQCPSCKTTFKATGARPLTTTCPGCGKKGILR